MPLKLIVVSPDAPQSMNNSLKPSLSLSLPCTVAEKIKGIRELIILPQCLVNRRTEIWKTDNESYRNDLKILWRMQRIEATAFETISSGAPFAERETDRLSLSFSQLAITALHGWEVSIIFNLFIRACKTNNVKMIFIGFRDLPGNAGRVDLNLTDLETKNFGQG